MTAEPACCNNCAQYVPLSNFLKSSTVTTSGSCPSHLHHSVPMSLLVVFCGSGATAAVNKAKSRGLKVLLGTLAPYRGAGYFSEPGERERQAFNAWIRTNAAVDGVVDFEQVLRNPADPSTLNPAYDSGDHLHPNDAGYAAMAAAIDLARLQ